MTDIDLIKFHKSIVDELDVIKNRVRNLIGDKHWGEEGRYKEAVLKNMIKRFLPKSFSIGTGFVVANYWSEAHITSQIDIIIYDNTHPLLFQEGDFVIVAPQSVRAIIEVKTSVRSSDFESIVKKIVENSLLIRKNQGCHVELINQKNIKEEYQELFIGLFSYDFDDKALDGLQALQSVYNSESRNTNDISLDKYFINNIALSKDKYLKFQKKSNTEKNITLYDMSDLAHSYFISNLLLSLHFLAIYPNYGVWFPFNEDDYVFKKVELQ